MLVGSPNSFSDADKNSDLNLGIEPKFCVAILVKLALADVEKLFGRK